MNAGIDFNWKSFIKVEYPLLSAWLKEKDFEASSLVVLKIIILILRGEQEPARIMSAACSEKLTLSDMLRIDLASREAQELQQPILQLLQNWLHSLPRDSAFLGQAYEKLTLSRRLQGNYYTPNEVIDFIIEQTVARCDIIANPAVKVLDPACGCGYFLLKAYDVLTKKFQQARPDLALLYPQCDWSEAGIHRHIIQTNLWGADIDETAATITRICLQLKHPVPDRPSDNITVQDSLLRSVGSLPDTGSGSYDYVIGNPPYLSFGLRGAGKLEPHYRTYLRQEYDGSAEYKLSYYALFIQRGIELLKTGGCLGYIIPDSFLLGRYYSKIRNYIMTHTVINSLAHINCNVFRNASTGYSAICILQKESNAAAQWTNIMNIYRIEATHQLRTAQPVCCYEQSYFRTQPFQRFRLFFDLSIRAIIEKIDASGHNLKTYASGHTGIRSLTRQTEIVALERKGENWLPGLISGSQIRRYRLEYNGHWLHIDPGMLYKGGWKKTIVEQRKILIRQTADTVIAAIDNNGFYHLNNIHCFVLNTTIVTLEYLLLVLNSRLMSFYYHVTSMEYGRAMAQTDIETLELLPIRVNTAINLQAPGLVTTMSKCAKAGKDGELGRLSKPAAFDEYLNQLVYRIYDLTDAEIACIERYESGLSRRPRRKAGY